jgi:hypothetical protein
MEFYYIHAMEFYYIHAMEFAIDHLRNRLNFDLDKNFITA